MAKEKKKQPKVPTLADSLRELATGAAARKHTEAVKEAGEHVMTLFSKCKDWAVERAMRGYTETTIKFSPPYTTENIVSTADILAGLKKALEAEGLTVSILEREMGTNDNIYKTHVTMKWGE